MSTDAKNNTALMEKIVSLCKRRGFIFQSSEIYGGCGGVWDYGPLGAELKRNLRNAWWTTMTREREDVLGLDASILMNPAIWKASGHVDTFADLMRECSLTNKRVRADHVDPQEGVIMNYTGAEAPTGWKLDRVISVLMKKGEHIESLRKRVRTLIASNAGEAAGKPEEIVLLGEAKGDTVEKSIDFHPETGGALGPARPFNLMLKTYLGPTATEDDVTYLRPETAQAIFAQFKNVFDSNRMKVPFGICQIGKAFRNEVTPKNFTFRSREFEQMELEFFIKPDEAVEIISGEVAQWSEGADLSEPQANWGWDLWHRYWVDQRTKFYDSIGLGGVLEYYWQTPEDLAHYARACVDILCDFPFGTEELEGIAARGEFDLSQHQKHSGKTQEVFDEELKNAAAKLTAEQKEALIQKRLAAEQAKVKGEPMPEADVRAWFERLFKGNYVPHVIEPSAGLDRMALAIIANAFNETEKVDDKGKKEIITVLRFHPRVAPIKVGVFPLLKNKPELVAKAREVYALLKKHMNCFYDETASIGRRYARQDEVGTPFGITIDFETLGEKGPELQDTVTLRHRDGGEQERVKISDLLPKLLAAVS
ncbi:glycyl-tRNA synthetase [Prosthecobacter debontii]|uniref:glycine--tRNA ligase n=1 Tax=Prosthecobacter debontii TaxID=48467 RepID=A0A1T4Z0P7_9BACT|nr:glycine--tRNA ligase [Prosthecobacter debontii]SKB07378.1 glycyl-tRNA synthetase [Prosthecobacter debontii]